MFVECAKRDVAVNNVLARAKCLGIHMAWHVLVIHLSEFGPAGEFVLRRRKIPSLMEVLHARVARRPRKTRGVLMTRSRRRRKRK